MAITVVIDGVTAAVTLASAIEFPISSRALVTADYLKVGQNAIVYRKGPSGNYLPATNEKGAIALSAYPNTAVIDGPGLYKITKDLSDEAYVGYEE